MREDADGSAVVRQRESPQTRGRELARQGRQLWQETGSVRVAAAQLISRNRNIPSIQAFRYAAGLSQDQAAARYNDVTRHQTSLGGTTINAWETWARTRGSGSPPSFSSLLILAAAYGRGPLGLMEEDISPGDLVAETYERLPPEDQLALKLFTGQTATPGAVAESHGCASPAAGYGTVAVPGRSQEQLSELLASPAMRPGDMRGAGGSQVGESVLPVPTVENGNPEIRVLTLANDRPGQLLNLSWGLFGLGIERLIGQVKNLGRRVDADVCLGINEAGLVMATFLASAQFSRCPVGYLKCTKVRDDITLDSASFLPDVGSAPTVFICDFEVKHADVAGLIAREVRTRYPGAELYFAVFGAMTKETNLDVQSFDDLTGAKIMRDAGFAAVFIAATMGPPGIEPPLELR